MNEENIKLGRVKKSCKALKIVTRILFCIGIFATGTAIISAIVILASGSTFDDAMNKSIEEGYYTDSSSNGSTAKVMKAEAFNIDLGSLSPEKIKEMTFESDVPAVQAYLDEHPYSFTYGIYLIIVSCVVALFTFVMFMLNGIFKQIILEESPFHKSVLKRVLVCGIILSVCLAFTAGFGIGIIGGLLTWAVYTIMDYGLTLQIQADETL